MERPGHRYWSRFTDFAKAKLPGDGRYGYECRRLGVPLKAPGEEMRFRRVITMLATAYRKKWTGQ